MRPAPAGLVIRPAARDDVPAIVHMLADDPIGRTREAFAAPLPDCYYAAFDAITAQPGNALFVAELDGRVAGTYQFTAIPCLTHRGGTRALVEAVHVHTTLRGRGIGETMMRHAIDRARTLGCRIVQLTSDARRTDAHRFYERLGFVPSHVGMKLSL